MKKICIGLFIGTLLVSGCENKEKVDDHQSKNYHDLENNTTEKKASNKNVCRIVDNENNEYTHTIYFNKNKLSEYRIDVVSNQKIDNKTKKEMIKNYDRMINEAKNIKGYNFSYKIKDGIVNEHFYYNLEKMNDADAKNLGLTKNNKKLTQKQLLDKIKKENKGIKCK